jgi:hypothetical protein
MLNACGPLQPKLIDPILAPTGSAELNVIVIWRCPLSPKKIPANILAGSYLKTPASKRLAVVQVAPVVFSVITAVVLVVPRRMGPRLKLVGIHVKRGVAATACAAVKARVPLTLALAGHSALPLTSRRRRAGRGSLCIDSSPRIRGS